MPFRSYDFADLLTATNSLSQENLISDSGDGDLQTSTFRGILGDGRPIAVKKFSNRAWSSSDHFKDVAIRAGSFGHPRLVPLIGYSFNGPWMFLVAEFMPNDSLGNHLFKATKRKTMEWSMRLRVAYYIAEALEYCINEGRALYFDLNPNKVLFDEAGNPCLSCFGLVKNHRDARCYSQCS